MIGLIFTTMLLSSDVYVGPNGAELGIEVQPEPNAFSPDLTEPIESNGKALNCFSRTGLAGGDDVPGFTRRESKRGEKTI